MNEKEFGTLQDKIRGLDERGMSRWASPNEIAFIDNN
jgi:hypothetical protein